MATVVFCFDYISPFAYLAWHRLLHLRRTTAVDLDAQPVLFAALLSAHRNIGPAEVESKREYIFLHCQRIAQSLDLPFKCPPSHPFRPLLPLRLTLAVEDPVRRERLVGRLFDRVWGQGQAIDSEAAIAPCLEAAGFDPKVCFERVQDPAIKQALAHQTEEAIGKGVFGVPSMLLGDELFWGVDSIAHLQAWLTGAKRPEQQEFERWRMVEASAVRKRT